LIAGALAEGGLQAAIGGALGLALSAVTVRVLESLAPAAFGGGIGTGMSAGIASAAVVMILICTGASGVFPIAATLDADVQSACGIGRRRRDGSSPCGARFSPRRSRSRVFSCMARR
jgi:hypothetical protein